MHATRVPSRLVILASVPLTVLLFGLPTLSADEADEAWGPARQRRPRGGNSPRQRAAGSRRTIGAGPGHAVQVGDRYHRKGAVQLFAGLLVHRGETLARRFDRKRFAEFQLFLRMLSASLWCKRIRTLHLILDNASTHAPKQLATWIRSLGLRFEVNIHWLPVHASWLDQIEIVFSVLQRKVLMPNDFASRQHVERRILTFFAERNRTARPIHWSYTTKQLMAAADRYRRLAAS